MVVNTLTLCLGNTFTLSFTLGQLFWQTYWGPLQATGNCDHFFCILILILIGSALFLIWNPLHKSWLCQSPSWCWAILAWWMGWCGQNEAVFIPFLWDYSQTFLFYCVAKVRWMDSWALQVLFLFVNNHLTVELCCTVEVGVFYSIVLVMSLWTVSQCLFFTAECYLEYLLVRINPIEVSEKTSKYILLSALVNIWIIGVFARITLLRHSFTYHFPYLKKL